MKVIEELIFFFFLIIWLWQKSEEEGVLGSEDPFQSCRNRNGGRAFMPFKAYPGFPVARKEEKEELPVHGLSLLTPGIKNPREESGSNGLRTSCGKSVSSSAPNAIIRSGAQQTQQQTARKQRRCWSPELHRRFVNALQQLGGSQGLTLKLKSKFKMTIWKLLFECCFG